ncbi:MAG: hypothetical protein S4CHLAM102_05700 [Chlamydiia bacterium]|nr:hypothetical protein [Chlamydiia bacterium]
MRWKWIGFGGILLIVIVVGIAVFPKGGSTSCPFCKKEILNRQAFYEDDLVWVLYTHKPVLDSHFLIVPKRHVEDLSALSEEEVLQIHKLAGRVQAASCQAFGTHDYFIHQKNGIDVGQSVPHLHFHLIARKPGDGSSVKFVWNLITSNVKGPISKKKMAQRVEKMRIAMEKGDV